MELVQIFALNTKYSLGFLQQLQFPQLEHTKVNVFLAENQEF